MANPITWHNVNAGGGHGGAGAALSGMNAAQNSFNSALDGLGKVMNQRYEYDQEGQVAAFKEALQNARTPDDVRALH